MSEFQREERYIVIKRKHLDEAAESALRGVIAGLDLETIECIVVEWDHLNYEATWQAVQQVAEGTYDPDEIATLRQQLQQSEARCAMLTEGLHAIVDYPDVREYVGTLCHDKALTALQGLPEAWLLRKQAEAVEAVADGPYGAASQLIPGSALRRAANRLRQQADELGGGWVMSNKALERVFGPDWRKVISDIRWQSQHSAAERHKRTGQRLKYRGKGSETV